MGRKKPYTRIYLENKYGGSAVFENLLSLFGHDVTGTKQIEILEAHKAKQAQKAVDNNSKVFFIAYDAENDNYVGQDGGNESCPLDAKACTLDILKKRIKEYLEYGDYSVSNVDITIYKVEELGQPTIKVEPEVKMPGEG